MNPDLVPMLLDVSVDPCDGSVHPSLQYVLIRGFAAMGWEQPKAASEDMAMEILKMIRPKLASGGTVAPSVQPLVGERPSCQEDRPDAGCVREALAWALPLAEMTLERHRLDRIRCGHTDIVAGDIVGLWPDEVKARDDARAALSKPADAGNASVEARCKPCDGTGNVIDDPDAPPIAECPSCNGTGASAEARLPDWGQIVQILLRCMDATIKNETSREQAERMANELLEKYPALSAVGGEAKKSEGVQSAYGEYTPITVRASTTPSDPTADRREIVAREPGFIKPDTDRQVFFYEQDFYVLSNFSAFEVEWSGFTFKTSEHLYHWLRFTLSDDLHGSAIVARDVKNARSAHDAFKIAQANKQHQMSGWNDAKVGFMRRILQCKVEQHEYVRRKLLATGDRELIEDSWRDDFWGWGPNRDGQNMLGKLWMEVRAELRRAALDGGRGA